MNSLDLSQASWIIVDWGTTNFRAFLMDHSNQVLDKIESKMGLLNVMQAQFEESLLQALTPWRIEDHPMPIFMAGMVGSKQGWHEVPYISTPVALMQLSQSNFEFRASQGQLISIVPGVSHQLAPSKHDVMRGEEVQILGLMRLWGHDNGFDQSSEIILPGTHSKHAKISHGNLQSFSTFMTGEFYALLSEHSILGRNLTTQLQSLEAFKQGVRDGAQGNLMNTAFMARTHRLFEHLHESEVHDYLSGLVIGKEVNDIESSCYVISNEKLGARYALACDELNKQVTTFDADQCFVAGMVAIWEQSLCHTH